MADQIAEIIPSPESTDGTAPEGQGQPTDQPSAVQPEGQGQQDGTNGLYDLTSVPEEYRSHVERIAKDIDRNVNGKLSEAADYRKRWEAFEELGLDEVGADGVAALLQFAEALTDPDAARDAILNLAANVGVDLEAAEPAAGDQGGGEGQTVAELRQQVADLQERLDGRDHADLTAQERQKLQSEWTAVQEAHKAAHNRDFAPEELTALSDLARRFASDHDEPIKAAYDFMQKIAGAGASQFVESAPTAPAAAAPSGQPATTVKPPDTFEEAEALHRERRRAAMQAV